MDFKATQKKIRRNFDFLLILPFIHLIQTIIFEIWNLVFLIYPTI